MKTSALAPVKLSIRIGTYNVRNTTGLKNI